MQERTPLGSARPDELADFWRRFLRSTGRSTETAQPDAWPFGDSVELADELLALVLEGTKRATAGSVAEYELEHTPLPQVGDFEIILDGAMQPRAVIEVTDVRVGPLSSVDDKFAYDEGEGDRSRDFWLKAHTEFFARFLPTIGVAFDPEMGTIFQRFDVPYQQD